MSTIGKIVALLLVLALPANAYRFMGSPLDQWMGVLASVIFIAAFRKFHLPKYYIVLMVYLLIIPPVVTIISGTPGNLLLTLIPNTYVTFTLFMLCLNDDTPWQDILRFYKVVVYISICVFYVQEISFLATGRRPMFILPFFEHAYYQSRGMNAETFALSAATAGRSPSIFLEPAHYIQFIMPYFAYKCADAFKERSLSRELVFLAVTIILSMSGCGYFLLCCIVIFLIVFNEDTSIGKKVVYTFLTAAVVMAAMSLFSDSRVVSYIFGRAGELSLSQTSGGAHSAFLRAFRGYYIFGSMPFQYRVFGIGAGSLLDICSSVEIEGVSYAGTYMNAIQMMLCRGGYIGTALFIIFLGSLFKRSCFEARCVFAAMIGLLLIETSWFNARMFFYILIMFSLNLRDDYVGCENDEEEFEYEE